MSAGRNLLLQRGRQRAQELRPATLTYNGTAIPCTPGNLEFFERLAPDGSGFTPLKNLHVTLLREAIPAGVIFKRGQNVTVTDGDSGESYSLIVGQNNSTQAKVLILNLEVPAA